MRASSLVLRSVFYADAHLAIGIGVVVEENAVVDPGEAEPLRLERRAIERDEDRHMVEDGDVDPGPQIKARAVVATVGRIIHGAIGAHVAGGTLGARQRL